MRFVRRSPARRLVLLAVVLVAAAFAGIAAVSAFGGSGARPPQTRLDRALRTAATAAAPAGITARVVFTNGLVPSMSFPGAPGSAGSALLNGASGRLWWTPGRGRLELQSDAGDTQILWDDTAVTVWDSSSNTVYTVALPASSGQKQDGAKPSVLPLAAIDQLLAKLGVHANVSAPASTNVAGEPAYRVTVSPKQPGGLLGSLALAWDAQNGVPLDVAVYARGQTSPALELRATQISFGSVSASDLSVTPPATAKHVNLKLPASSKEPSAAGAKKTGSKAVVGLAGVRRAVGFRLAAPARVAGRARTEVRLLRGKHPGALLLYGTGLGTVAVIERAAAGSAAPAKTPLPLVPLGRGISARELPTALGTVLTARHGGIAVIVAGSVRRATAEAAARAILR